MGIIGNDNFYIETKLSKTFLRFFWGLFVCIFWILFKITRWRVWSWLRM